MCGIAAASVGGRGSAAADDAVRDALTRLRHRGPDGEGVVGDRDSAVGMTRLRVRSAPADPLPFRHDGHAYAFNGEVYRADGRVPGGGLGEAVAADLLPDDRLDGMWALAHRLPDGTVTVRRDPHGIKPLFLLEGPDLVAVASEIGALLPVLATPSVRPAALVQYLLFNRVVDGGTFLEGIRPVARGERLVLRGGRVVSSSTAADPPVAPRDPDGPDGPSGEELRAAFRSSMDRMLLSERPLGVAVSGGLDSTLVAHELARRGRTDITTVSVLPDADTGHADGVADLAALGLPGGAWRSWQHHRVSFGPHDLLDGLDDAVAALGEPSGLTSVPMYARLARLARDAGIVVLLLGEGADELFGGYRSYLSLDRLADPESFVVDPDRVELVRGLVGPEAVADARAALRAALPDHADVPSAVRLLEREHSLEPLLRRCDHLLMAGGIEGRTPFLHGGLPGLANALPWSRLVGDGRTKRALRDAWSGRVPGVDDAKRPFRAPVRSWFAGTVGGRVRDGLTGHRERLASLGVRPDGLDAVAQAMLDGRPGAAELAYALLALGSWSGGPTGVGSGGQRSVLAGAGRPAQPHEGAS